MTEKREGPGGLSRRRFIGSGMAVAGLGLSAGEADALPQLAMKPLDALPSGQGRWLGGSVWGNRLHDWRVSAGWLECRPLRERRLLSTAALLPVSVGQGDGAIEMELTTWGKAVGFAGFLIGAGGGNLDWRGAALVQGGSGIGGGLLAVISADGVLSFREHVDETRPFIFNALASHSLKAGAKGMPAGARLRLYIARRDEGADLRLQLLGPAGEVLAEEELRSASKELVAGGVMLAAGDCSPQGGWRFTMPQLGGSGFVVNAAHRLGPVVSCLHSLSRGVLKLSAQCLPLDPASHGNARLEVRRTGGSWRKVADAPLGDGASVQFRVEGWDNGRAHEYRVRLTVDGRTHSYNGHIRAEPKGRALRIGLFSCVAATLRVLDGPAEPLELSQARACGRFDPLSIVFPHDPLVRSAAGQKPDLLVFCGDQFYEQFPTRGAGEKDPAASAEEICLDGLYKWLLWCWAFAPLTRDVPSIVMMDDHDYFQPNYWGNGGRAAPERDHNRGGYTRPAEYVRMMERAETGHNPDAFDPQTVDQGISVYYGAFVYGGVSFAVLEDRKFKTGLLQGADLDVYEGQLLGPRQEKFLRDWRTMDSGLPKVVLTQTVWGCPQTTPEGLPLIDFDSNGFPSYNRRVAVNLVRQCRALMLSGDQHMASLVRHGIDAYDDGPLQFTGPAGGVGWQRWFEPVPLANPRSGTPNTGDFVDGFGNKMHVLAVAQPRITLAEYRRQKGGRTQRIMDRALKREGFGIVVVDAANATMRMECWPWDAADQPKPSQYDGWPFEISFDQL